MIARFVTALMLLNTATPISGDAQRRMPSLNRRSAVAAPRTSAAVTYPPTTVLTRDAQMNTDTLNSRGRLTAAWILGVEASIAVLSSVGYFARAAGSEPEAGAKQLGEGLLYGGFSLGVLVLPLGITAYPGDKGLRVFGIACGAAMLAGGYNLFLAANQDPTAAQVFRANVIALNAAAVATWLVARRLRLLR